MRIRIFVMLAVLGALAVACGVPRSGKFTAIDPNNVPVLLTETTSTTTTLPPTTTTILQIDTTTPATEVITAAPTTIVETAPVVLYYVSGTQLHAITEFLAGPVTIGQTMTALQTGPPPDVGSGLRNALPMGTDSRVTKSFGVATVELDPHFLIGMDSSEERLAIGQIVLTLTQQSGVGSVRFMQNGEDLSVVLSDGTTLSQEGQLLFSEDYQPLLDNTPETTTTTTTSVPTSSPANEETTVPDTGGATANATSTT
ncbi:MAG TPA: GerMN domain-containing protein, partial [Ilumatobacteraceae bacterium]